MSTLDIDEDQGGMVDSCSSSPSIINKVRRVSWCEAGDMVRPESTAHTQQETNKPSEVVISLENNQEVYENVPSFIRFFCLNNILHLTKLKLEKLIFF